MERDFVELLAELLAADARFLVVGAHALAAHGAPRFTQDLDVWVDPAEDNADRVWRALLAFGAPVSDLGIGPDDVRNPDMVMQFGLPPVRIDVMTSISGVESFATAWSHRVVQAVGNLPGVPFLGRAELLANKKASGRLKDLVDLETLRSPDVGA